MEGTTKSLRTMTMGQNVSLVANVEPEATKSGKCENVTKPSERSFTGTAAAVEARDETAAQNRMLRHKLRSGKQKYHGKRRQRRMLNDRHKYATKLNTLTIREHDEDDEQRFNELAASHHDHESLRMRVTYHNKFEELMQDEELMEKYLESEEAVAPAPSTHQRVPKNQAEWSDAFNCFRSMERELRQVLAKSYFSSTFQPFVMAVDYLLDHVVQWHEVPDLVEMPSVLKRIFHSSISITKQYRKDSDDKKSKEKDLKLLQVHFSTASSFHRLVLYAVSGYYGIPVETVIDTAAAQPVGGALLKRVTLDLVTKKHRHTGQPKFSYFLEATRGCATATSCSTSTAQIGSSSPSMGSCRAESVHSTEGSSHFSFSDIEHSCGSDVDVLSDISDGFCAVQEMEALTI